MAEMMLLTLQDAQGASGPEGHDRCRPGDARDARTVVSDSGDRSRDMGAVVIGIHGVGVAIHKIVAQARGDVARQVRVVVIHARIDDGDEDGVVSLRDVPGFGCMNIGALRYPLQPLTI